MKLVTLIGVFMCSLALTQGQSLQPDLCKLPLQQGPCEAAFPKWFYNVLSGQCEQFLYGGCEGNDNQFDTMQQCENTCIPELLGATADCDAKQCYMFCDGGFKKDVRGCDVCECADPVPEPSGDCSQVQCLMECPDGFKKDTSGCPICECRTQEQCTQGQCLMECPGGFKKDTSGCPICECAPPAEPACPVWTCFNLCPRGRLMDASGCETCQCQIDPCQNHLCPKGQQCQMIEPYSDPTAVAAPKCVDPRTAVGCSNVMCMMYCEHGFKTDVLGCARCECRESAAPEDCGGDCRMWCDWGYKYGEDGCRTCHCLEDPCLSYECPQFQVCEAHRPCQGMNCPAKARCIGDGTTKRLSVNLEFAHKPLTKELEMEVFKQKLVERISHLLHVSEQDIKRIVIERPTPFTISVEFHVINDGEGDVDLVAAYEKFKQSVIKHENSAVLYGDVTFVPEHATLESSFSSSAALPEQGEASGGHVGGTKLIVIVGCAVGASILLVVVISLALYLTRRKQNRMPSKMAYNKAPLDDVSA